MTSLSYIGAWVVVIIITTVLYWQTRVQQTEGFTLQSSSQSKGSSVPTGRQYDPAHVPSELNHSPHPYVTSPPGSMPQSLTQQKPTGIPGGGTNTMPRDSLAQAKDLRELDNKISTWLDAASQKEREQPGSLTTTQCQERILLMARQRAVRDQIGTGNITDTWKRVADETLNLRRENQGWQQMAPNLDEVYSFGSNSNSGSGSFLTVEQYSQFYGLFNAAIQELQNLAQPDPLQNVRLQQLQVMRQELMDLSRTLPDDKVPPIKMAAAQLYLKQMLKPDQPLPSLLSIDGTISDRATPSPLNPADILRDLQQLTSSWDFTFHATSSDSGVGYAQGLSAANALMNKIKNKQISPEVASQRVADLHRLTDPVGFSDGDGDGDGGRGGMADFGMLDIRRNRMNPNKTNTKSKSKTNTKSTTNTTLNQAPLVIKAQTLCRQVQEAFPEGDDAAALGCVAPHTITDTFKAETVINTVCNRIRTSVPTVTPEQFGCPSRRV